MPIDESLRARRRASETASLVTRAIGSIATALFGLGVGGIGPADPAPQVEQVCVVVAVLLAATCVLSFLNRRRPSADRYTGFSILQTVLDTVTVTAFVAQTQRYTGQATWPLLALPIVIGASRNRLPGAMAVWAATSAALIAPVVPIAAERTGAIFLNLMIAVITGSQSSALARHLADLQETRRALQHQATHDPLTGLPNRAQLAGYADDCAARPLVVLLLDLNGFKKVNDTHGHAVGDLLLHEIGTRLVGVLGAAGLAGRLGGDEFLVLLPETGPDQAAPIVERLRAAIRRPVEIGTDRTVTVGVSIGIASRPAGGAVGLDVLTAEADAAMYRDKRGPIAAETAA
ncbi:GGDEF domain-containing protein [Actinoplanes sp. NBRC 101535]|uniref:GGDEF domain-containing protein n=1 Tax=Actinoplanes sp. NBRC 101535 TaxID=3032196 RepID=UPI0024A26649|nr:GGDEF domain-containing protein [Actinoplanes sp. NBRC 101535]GLY04304.1 hypothetical protein Acsp01_46830 [Actinoplanes sp. NBRC 101535]